MNNGDFCIVEYTRYGKQADLMGVIKSISDNWVTVETKEGRTFLIPRNQIQNIKVMGKPKW